MQFSLLLGTSLVILFSGALFAQDPAVVQTEATGSIKIVEPATPESTIPIEGIQGQRTVKSGDPIFSGDRISTQTGQSVILFFKDKSEVTLPPMTQIQLKKYDISPEFRDAEIQLETGVIHLTVSPSTRKRNRFLVRTAAATMGVRGTEFVVEHNAVGESNLYTLEGAVAIAKTPEDLEKPGSFKMVNQGTMSSLKGTDTTPSEPKKFNKKTLMEYLGKRAPQVVTQIQNHKAASLTHTAAPKKGTHWKPKRPRRQFGH